MTPADLETAARRLFGFDFPWQSALARALGVNPRTLRHWIAGNHPIPEWVPGKIAELAHERRDALSHLVVKLNDGWDLA